MLFGTLLGGAQRAALAKLPQTPTSPLAQRGLSSLRARPPRWRVIVGVTSVLAGVQFTALGALAIANLPGGPCPPLFDPMHPPPSCDLGGNAQQYNLGVGFAVAGGALVLTGVGLLAWPGPRQVVRVP